MQERVQDDIPLTLQRGFLRQKHELALLLARHGEVALRGKGRVTPVGEGFQIRRVQIMLGEKAAVVRAVGQHALGEVVAQATELPLAPDLRRG